MDHAAFAAKLKTISLFKELDDAFFDKFISELTISKFNHGDHIIKEGEVGSEMFILLKGTVRINKKTMKGDEYTVALLKDEQGIFFGEVGLLCADQRSASVLAETHCEMAVLSRDRLNSFLEQNSVYGVKVLRALATSICNKLIKSNHDTIVLYEALIGEIGQSFL